MSAACNLTIPRKQCTLDTCCMQQAVIDYRPSLAGNLIYAGIFAALLLAQMIQVIFLYRNTWGFFIGMAASLTLELVGYIGRIMIYNNPFNLNNFIIYLVCLTIGPAFMMASIYVCIGRVVVAVGAQNSRIKPRSYALICIGGDLISLVLQSLGGAMAATAVKSTTGQSSQTGVHVMIAGLIFQLVSTLVFATLCGDFASRCLRNKSSRNPVFADLVASGRFRLFIGALILATVTIFIRSVFRVAELWNGFGSELANDQTTFMIFEGPMLIAAGLALTVFHPGFAFKGNYGLADRKAAVKPQEPKGEYQMVGSSTELLSGQKERDTSPAGRDTSYVGRDASYVGRDASYVGRDTAYAGSGSVSRY